MNYPPVQLEPRASKWYGRLVRRSGSRNPEPLLPIASLRREDTMMVVSLAKMLAALDVEWDRHLNREANALMAQLGCSPAARQRFHLAAEAEKASNEFDRF